MLWFFLFNPTVGMVAFFLKQAGVDWNHTLNGDAGHDAGRHRGGLARDLLQLPVLPGRAAVASRSRFIEAAAIDGAGPWRRFWTIVFPLLSPTTFFLLVVNIVYAFFDTFGVIHAITRGGPDYATEHPGLQGLQRRLHQAWTSAARPRSRWS
ncbi:MAG: ABC transporter permease subunit [Desulfobacterales bacterium]|nr:ABC transporter permease subunit [Desulfobacterales bacterium]